MRASWRPGALKDRVELHGDLFVQSPQWANRAQTRQLPGRAAAHTGADARRSWLAQATGQPVIDWATEASEARRTVDSASSAAGCKPPTLQVSFRTRSRSLPRASKQEPAPSSHRVRIILP